jgi:hypothetical protein
MEDENYPWLETEKGWCTEISELPNKRLLLLPECPLKVSFGMFTPVKDQENEITHWTMRAFNGKIYEIFND